MDGTGRQLDDQAVLERFARKVVAGGAAYAVSGADGIAGVPSKSGSARLVEFLWSDRTEALRWADALVDAPTVVTLDLAALTGPYLARVKDAGHRVGADWSDGPDEAEFEAGVVADALSAAMLEEFDDAIAAERHVWLLRAGDGSEALTVLTGVHERLAVPVFASREGAQRAAAALWPAAVAVRQSAGEFIQRTLYDAIEKRLVFVPAFAPGRPAIVHMPWDIKARLQGLIRREARIVA